MAAAPPPVPVDGQLPLPPFSSPSIPVTLPNMLLGQQTPEHLQHGGVGRAADSRSEGCEMDTDGVGMVGGQDHVDGDDPQIDRDGGGSWPKKLNDSSLIPNITKGADDVTDPVPVGDPLA